MGADEKITDALSLMLEATERDRNQGLEICKDGGVKYTRYVTMGLKDSVDEKFFEHQGKTRPLQVAKNWAREQGYKYLVLVSLKLGVDDKIYRL